MQDKNQEVKKDPFIMRLKEVTGHTRRTLADILLVSPGMVQKIEMHPDVHGSKGLQPNLVGTFGIREGLCDASNVLQFIERYKKEPELWLSELEDDFRVDLYSESENRMGKPLPDWIGELDKVPALENDPSYVDVREIEEFTGRSRQTILRTFQGIFPVVQLVGESGVTYKYLVRANLLQRVAEQYRAGNKYRMLMK